MTWRTGNDVKKTQSQSFPSLLFTNIDVLLTLNSLLFFGRCLSRYNLPRA